MTSQKGLFDRALSRFWFAMGSRDGSCERPSVSQGRYWAMSETTAQLTARARAPMTMPGRIRSFEEMNPVP